MYQEEDYLMLSGIQHFSFCRRQWALIHIEMQWAENYRTVSGELMHKRVHDESVREKRGDKIVVRGMRVSSSVLGLSGQCDAVEFIRDKEGISLYGYEGTWKAFPVEYKRGKPKESHEDEVQLCAQAICLEEMLMTEIKTGGLYYGETRHRKVVELSESLREETIQLSAEMHQLYERAYTPKVKKTKKCSACSLNNICLPRLEKITKVDEYIASMLGEGNDNR